MTHSKNLLIISKNQIYLNFYKELKELIGMMKFLQLFLIKLLIEKIKNRKNMILIQVLIIVIQVYFKLLKIFIYLPIN